MFIRNRIQNGSDANSQSGPRPQRQIGPGPLPASFILILFFLERTLFPDLLS